MQDSLLRQSRGFSFGQRGLVQTRIEYLHDLAADFHGIRDIDHISKERRNPGGERRLAITWRPEQEHCAPGVYRWQKLAKIVLGNHKPLEAPSQTFSVQYFVRNSLPLNLFLVGRQTYRRRPEIEILVRSVFGCGPALIA